MTEQKRRFFSPTKYLRTEFPKFKANCVNVVNAVNIVNAVNTLMSISGTPTGLPPAIAVTWIVSPSPRSRPSVSSIAVGITTTPEPCATWYRII